MKLSGSILPYTLMVTALIGGLLGALSFSNYLFSQYLNRSLGLRRAKHNLYSGLQGVLAGNRNLDTAWIQSFPSLPSDSFEAKTEPWGYWEIAHITGSYLNHRMKKSFLLGRRPHRTELPGLWPIHSQAPLTLAGNCRISGPIGLYPEQIRYSSSRELRFTGKAPNEAQFLGLSSPKSLLDNRNMKSRRLFSQEQIVLQQVQPEVFQEHLSQPWQSEVLWLYKEGDLHLGQVQLTGKIILQVTESLSLGAQTEIEGAILIAPEIRIQSGFKGSLQAIAHSRLEIDSLVYLSFPSLLMLTKDSIGLGRVHIQGNCQLDGALLLQQMQGSPLSFIGPRSSIRGLIRSDGYLDFRGKLTGRLEARGFGYQHTSAVYQDHLVDAQIEGAWPLPAFPLPINSPLDPKVVIQELPPNDDESQ